MNEHKPEGCKGGAARALGVPEASPCATAILTASLIGLEFKDGKIWDVLIVLYEKLRWVLFFF